MKLHTQILLALVAGIAVAGTARVTHAGALLHALIAVEPIGTIFIRLISMVVVPLVVASVFVSVVSIGGSGGLGRVGGWTLGYFVATTFAAAVIGVIVGLAAHLGQDAALSRGVDAMVSSSVMPAAPSAFPGWMQAVVNLFPQNPIASAAQGDLLPLIVAVCMFAAAAATISTTHRQPIVDLLTSVNEMAMVVIGWIMRLAPVGVFVLIAATIARSGVELLRSLLAFVMAVVVALALQVVLVLLPVLTIMARQRVRPFFKATSEALVLAFSTASSATTLPVTMANARTLHVPEGIGNFLLPIGATLNKNGAAAYKAVTAVFLAHVYGLPVGPSECVAIVLASTFAAFAGAGVPGSSLATTLIVLNAIGLGPNAAAGIALVTGIDRPLDMCRTTVNTLSNLVGAVFVARRVRS